MREEFIKESKIVDKSDDEKELDLYEEIEISKKKLKAYYENMNFATGNLIDYFSYQIKAEQAKFAYLMKEVKAKMEKENGEKV
ncbi:MAG: DUF2508 family protein [Clostridia bacterium]|nr:DUF2508 family protein [Clostridia bacterium]